TACCSPRSATRAWAIPPAARMEAATASTSSRPRAQTTTRAPRAASVRASAAPKPRPPPVMRTDEPAIFMVSDLRRPCQKVDPFANLLARAHPVDMDDAALADRVAANVKQLRTARGLTQAQASTAAGLPRATWAHLESGAANPTLQVIHRAAQALQASIEELIAAPHAPVEHFPAGSLPSRSRGSVSIRQLLPDPLPGMILERLELPPR